MREAVADQVRAPLLVRHAAAEELGAHLDHHVELAHVQGRLLPEPDLYVARLDRAGHRFLSAFDRLADNSRQQLAQVAQDLLIHAPAVRHVDQRHRDEAL